MIIDILCGFGIIVLVAIAVAACNWPTSGPPREREEVCGHCAEIHRAALMREQLCPRCWREYRERVLGYSDRQLHHKGPH